MTTVTIDDDLAARLQAVSPAGQGWRAFVADALRERLERVEREAARAEAQAVLNGPRRPFDPEATYQRYREKYGWSEDLSGLSDEELTDRFEAGLAAMSPD